MNVKLATIVMGLVLGVSAIAQENPNNFHSRHNADSVYNVDRPRQAPAAQQPAKPTGYWEKTCVKKGSGSFPSLHRSPSEGRPASASAAGKRA